jgi:two-component system OmpR family sensor kinase
MTEEKNITNNLDDASADSGFFRDISVEFLIHELKDPISVIETAVRMLLEKSDKYGPLTNRQEKTLKRALRNSKKARSLLADLLEVGRSDVGCFQCRLFNPVSVVEDVFMEALEATDAVLWEALQEIGLETNREAVLRQRDIRFTSSDGARCAKLCQDEAKFRQIVGNLIKNAFQHRRQLLEIRMDCREEQLIIDVLDDGPGVEKENRELIFKRYARLQECVMLSRTGHGLGLAGARILARHLGGDITVRNHHGAGAVFCLTLPLNLDKTLLMPLT